MALRESSPLTACRFIKRFKFDGSYTVRTFSSAAHRSPSRAAATAAATVDEDVGDLESHSSLSSVTAKEHLPEFDPLSSSRNRQTPLPRSRFQYKPPKYYRGPLHPHQPPPPSDPASRAFYPGPFSLPRLQQTYDSTYASDLMTLYYQHYPPGYEPPPPQPRLRSWDGSSPYHKGRPLRKPRGADHLNLVRKRITFRNIPQLTGVTVHSYVREALSGSPALHVATMALQAITGASCKAHRTKNNEPEWNVRADKFASLTCTLKGEAMYHFVSKVIDVVLPRIKDWSGVKASSGDDNGNISFGLTPDVVGMFPEIEVNYDAYPVHLIPGCHISLQTSARDDRDARLLLTAIGLPFYGKVVN